MRVLLSSLFSYVDAVLICCVALQRFVPEWPYVDFLRPYFNRPQINRAVLCTKCEQALEAHGFFVEIPCGAKLFVHPEQFEVVAEASGLPALNTGHAFLHVELA